MASSSVSLTSSATFDALADALMRPHQEIDPTQIPLVSGYSESLLFFFDDAQKEINRSLCKRLNNLQVEIYHGRVTNLDERFADLEQKMTQFIQQAIDQNTEIEPLSRVFSEAFAMKAWFVNRFVHIISQRDKDNWGDKNPKLKANIYNAIQKHATEIKSSLDNIVAHFFSNPLSSTPTLSLIVRNMNLVSRAWLRLYDMSLKNPVVQKRRAEDKLESEPKKSRSENGCTKAKYKLFTNAEEQRLESVYIFYNNIKRILPFKKFIEFFGWLKTKSYDSEQPIREIIQSDHIQEVFHWMNRCLTACDKLVWELDIVDEIVVELNQCIEMLNSLEERIPEDVSDEDAAQANDLREKILSYDDASKKFPFINIIKALAGSSTEDIVRDWDALKNIVNWVLHVDDEEDLSEEGDNKFDLKEYSQFLTNIININMRVLRKLYGSVGVNVLTCQIYTLIHTYIEQLRKAVDNFPNEVKNSKEMDFLIQKQKWINEIASIANFSLPSDSMIVSA